MQDSSCSIEISNFLRSSRISIPETHPTFEALLDYLNLSHGFDFTGYNRSTLLRRVQQRMQMIGISSYSDYGDYLQVHPEEFNHLFNTIEINVTGFFRDASAWDYVAAQIIPKIIAGKSESEPIRVWSAGCASGEETYTLAILLAEALGVEQFRSRVRLYGTDVDEDALNQARRGSYLSAQVVAIPGEFLNKYFEPALNRYVFRSDLRRAIIFFRHDMIQAAPMPQIDLLVCRNALIYFNLETQTRVFVRFHFSLKDSGFLFLGKAELLPTRMRNLFTSVNVQHHIFTKLPRGQIDAKLLVKALGRQQHRGR